MRELLWKMGTTTKGVWFWFFFFLWDSRTSRKGEWSI